MLASFLSPEVMQPPNGQALTSQVALRLSVQCALLRKGRPPQRVVLYVKRALSTNFPLRAFIGVGETNAPKSRRRLDVRGGTNVLENIS